MACRDTETDRPTRITYEKDDLAQFQRLDEPLDQIRQGGHGRWIARIRRREAEAREIQCDAAEVITQRTDEVAIQKGPVRSSVQEQQDWAFAFVDVMHAYAVEVGESTGKREYFPGQPLRAELLV